MPRIISEVTPTIEQRLAGWVTIHERQVAGAGTRQRPTLTISREFGCEGFPLAARLKELLDESTGESWTIFDRALIEMVAEDAVVTPRVLRHLGDMPRAFEAVGFHAEGTTLTQDAALRLAVDCGVPLPEAVAALTAVPARALGLGDRFGSLRAGAAADAVLLDDDLRVEAVWVDGIRVADD